MKWYLVPLGKIKKGNKTLSQFIRNQFYFSACQRIFFCIIQFVGGSRGYFIQCSLFPWRLFDLSLGICYLCRRKKLELATLVQSLQAAEEAANVAFTSPSFTEGTKETSEPASDRTKIVISIQDKNVTKQYRIFAVCPILCHSFFFIILCQ